MNTVGRASGAGHRTDVVYVIGTYPLLTTTFIDREIEQLRKHGLPVRVVSLRRPSGLLSPEQRAAVAGVRYLLPVPVTALLRSHLRYALHRPRAYWGALAYLLSRRHPSLRARLKTLLHFGEGVHVAYLLDGNGRHGHVHAHFVDRAAIVALVASRILGVPFSATAHANDIYVGPVMLREKIANARFIVTCTEQNAVTLRSVAGPLLSDRVVPIHHGLEPGRYEPGAPEERARPPVILAVGQLKEKKGFDHLIEACRILRGGGYGFTCHIVGDGPLRAALETRVRAHALDGVVTLCGALPHDEVVTRYRTATVFALPSVTGPDGDRDGIPNVILEAMAMALPVVASRHSGIPEAVEDGGSGLLVPSGDPVALAAALAELLDDPRERERMGRRGRQIVAERFDVAVNAKALLVRFEEVSA